MFSKSFCFIFLYLFCFIAKAQTNLVPNPSFEILSACPSSADQISLATGWFAATAGNVDLFNTCSTVIGLGVPLNFFHNFKYPKDGNGYVGMVTYKGSNAPTPNWLQRGFIEVKLNQALTVKRQYYLRFYFSPCKENTCDSSKPPCHSDAIGLALSKQRIDSPLHHGSEPLDLHPVIEHKGSVLNDTSIWYSISGCYSGNGETFLIIGNFQTDANTIGDGGCANFCGPQISYNYIDMVGVYEYDPLPDTILLCQGQHISLGHSFLDATYSWNTGSTDSTIIADSPGRYIVNATIDGCLLSDTVIVIDPSALISDMPHDTLSCLPLSLSIPVPGSYTWSDSSHADSITISDAGEYGLTITNTCGVYKTNFQVTGRPCECHVFVPNAFTPNGDGTNDIFQPGIACDFPIRNIRCIIADRWGEIVYCSLDEDIYNIKWDGTYKDKQQEPGIYILLFEYAYLENGTSHTTTVKGSITLIR